MQGQACVRVNLSQPRLLVRRRMLVLVLVAVLVESPEAPRGHLVDARSLVPDRRLQLLVLERGQAVSEPRARHLLELPERARVKRVLWPQRDQVEIGRVRRRKLDCTAI